MAMGQSSGGGRVGFAGARGAAEDPAGNEMEFLHFHMLAFFGMPIGEMWNLEELAEDCAADGKYDFFLTSAPLNIPGGVGSPPNALAIK